MNVPELECLDDYLDLHAEHTPMAEAAVLGATRLTYASLASQVDACAKSLLACRIERGDRVAVLITPRPEYLVIFLALARIGAMWVGLDPRYQRRELAYVVRDAEPRLLIALAETDWRDFRDDLEALTAAQPSIERLITISGDTGHSTRFEDFLDEGDSLDEELLATRRREVTSRDPICIVYTSGSTGEPKGAVLTHRSFVRTYSVQSRMWPVRPLRVLANLPVNHIGGLGDIGSYCLVGGGTLVLMERFDPQLTLELIERERVSVIEQMVVQLQRCAALPDFDRRDLSSLQIVAIGDGALPLPLLERLQSKAVRVTATLGLSEACGPLTYVDVDASPEVIAGTIGRPAPDYELRLAADDGSEAVAGKPGEIQVRGDFVMREYFRRPEATRAAFTTDGWLRTGDLARERPDGNWEILGRLKDMFKSGGYNVYPREIEAVLDTHPGVSLVTVVGVADEEYLEVGHAFVVPVAHAAVDAATLERHCRDQLAGYKVPRRFHIRDELPLLPNGKIDKPRVRREATDSSLAATKTDAGTAGGSGRR
jgi:acyl-CoA synthetase (AMP-forming)/AMP-acid ligase II